MKKKTRRIDRKPSGPSDDRLEIRFELDCETGSVRHYLFVMTGQGPSFDLDLPRRRVRIEAEMIISPFVNVVNREQCRGCIHPALFPTPIDCYLTRLMVRLRYDPPPWRRRK